MMSSKNAFFRIGFAIAGVSVGLFLARWGVFYLLQMGIDPTATDLTHKMTTFDYLYTVYYIFILNGVLSCLVVSIVAARLVSSHHVVIGLASAILVAAAYGGVVGGDISSWPKGFVLESLLLPVFMPAFMRAFKRKTGSDTDRSR